jgi:RNA binding exosome subunit
MEHLYLLKFIYYYLTLYLPVILILIIGVIVAYEDWQEGKIKNKWLKIGFLLGLFYYLIQIILSLVGYFNGLDFGYFFGVYYLIVLQNTALAFLIAFALWYFKLWAGGDAKYFLLLVFLLPLAFYTQAFFKYWPAINLLINIVIPIFIYLLFKILIYPLQLGLNYLRNPQLLREYVKNYINKHKIDKKKVRQYINSALSFLVILVFFQIFRTRLISFLNPFLGNLVTASYFVLGLYVFKPLRTLLQKQTILVIVILILYCFIGYFYFPQIVFADLHEIFALQMIFMLLYFYLFKYGQLIGKFLYNSSEVNIIKVDDLAKGHYINKSYISQLMGERNNFEDIKESLNKILSKEDNEKLLAIIDKRQAKHKGSTQHFELLMALKNLRLDSILRYVEKYYQDYKQKKIDNVFLEQIMSKLNAEQRSTLDDILKGTNDVKRFLKTLTGRLTSEQAEKLKAMIHQRNSEIIRQGLAPIEDIILHKTFSFAPFMLLGVIITIVTKSSLIHLVYQYILHR